MSISTKPYKDSTSSKKEQVSKMFDTISNEYDHLNRVISFGIDIQWRKKIVAMASQEKPNTILDIATGTGDLAILLAKTKARTIVGIDISKGMLEVGQEKVAAKQLDKQIKLVYGDSENIPFEDNYFDVVTVSFGIRNFENLEKGLSEILRVLKPGGLFLILETSVPMRFPFKQGYKIYTGIIMPLIGKLFSKDKVAYQYLADSASIFPFGTQLNNILSKVGFTTVKHAPQTMGVATIYSAFKKH